jgi:hypothetical protein
MEQAIPPEGSAVHVRYLESGTSKTLFDVAERETLGWLNSNTGKEIYIQHDRTVESLQNLHGSSNGIRIPISSILEICPIVERESD